MAEPPTGTLPPPLPPRNRTVPLAPSPRTSMLPRRPQVADTLQGRQTISSISPAEASVASAVASKSDSTDPETPSTQSSNGINSNTPLMRTTSASAIICDNATLSTHPSTTEKTQSSPKLPSLILSFILREPLERSHGRLSTITAVQSFFQSNFPARLPFEYSTLVDHALLASQIALHDPHIRKQKRLPLVLSLSIGAFLVAASGIISRYFGWALLAASMWFGPAQFVLKEMWYISVGLIALNFFVDIFPVVSLCTLLWISVICVSRLIDCSRNPRGEPTVAQFIHNTAETFQNENYPKRTALDMVQNVAEWWTYRQSQPERLRRAEEKATKKTLEEEKKLNKIRRAEMLKEQKQAEIDQKAVDKSKKLEEAKGRKRMKEEEKAERKNEDMKRKRRERENVEVEKQRKRDEELELNRTKLEQKERAKEQKKQEQLDFKRVKMLKKEKKLTAMEEKEGQTKENEELDTPRGI